MARLALLADLHGNFQIPPPKRCDLFLFAGDFFARKHEDYHKEILRQYEELPRLLDWLSLVPADEIYFIAGNHDYLLQALGPDTINYALREREIAGKYLENSGVSTRGLSIWGTPHVASSPDGEYPRSSAFVLDPEEYIRKVSLPKSDILLSHNAPWYRFKKTRAAFVDSKKAALHLRSQISRTQPRLAVCGHFHWMRGARKIGKTDILVPSATLPYLPGIPPYGTVHGDPYLYFDL